MHLTQGSIPILTSSEARTDGIKPILQVVEIRQFIPKIPSTTIDNGRYRIMLSDGVYLEQCMLSTQLNGLVHSQCIQNGSVVKLTHFVCTLVQNRRIVVVLDLDVMVEKCDPIGKPMPLKMDGTTISRPINQTMPSSDSGPGYQARSSFTAVPASACVDVPKPNSPVNAHILPSDINHALSSRPYGSSVGNDMESRRCSSLDLQPQYPRTESNHGQTHPPVNDNVCPPHASYQQTNPVLYNRGLTAQNEAFARVIIPIAALNPCQGRWTIKARVTVKGKLRHFNKPGGDGKVFSFELLDSDGGEIKVTCFNIVADQFYNQIEQGKVYMISKGSVRPAQKNYNHLCNDYEIFLENTSVIQPCFEDDNLVPKTKFRFRSISEIQGIEKESVVDVIGVVFSISPSVSILRKNGTETQKRTIQLKDMSGMSIDVTLWNFCNKEGHTLQNMYDSGVFPVLAIKSCKVNDFKGKSLGTIPTGQLLIEPDFPEAHELKAWLERDGKNTPSISISREKIDMIRTDVHKTISQIKDERIGTSEKPDWITVCATLTFIKVDNIVYSACPLMVGDRKCHKKVTSIGDGKWRCDRCCRIVDECEYRYALQFQIQDHTGLAWVTGFQESGEDIFGVPARDLYCIKYEEEDDDKFDEILHFARFRKYLFKLRLKEETFGDEPRVKSTASKVEKVNFASDTKYLFNLISKSKSQSGALSVGPFNSTSGSGMLGLPSVAMNCGGSSGNVIKDHAPPAYLASPYRNQSNVSRPSALPSTVMYLRCSSCGGTGHSSTNCPSPMNPQRHCHGSNVGNRAIGATRGRSVASIECFKCRQIGRS
ncbi:DNA metabolism protein [Lithospermum erythrorhizon]|uniref:Replication protein A subunit n=1 Tax=Lithospermum erythrorhizon TaxID=34254 RepID=A0AAV3QSI5_LITER